DRAPPGRARRSGASAAHAACDAARDEMGEPQGLRDVAVQGRRTNQRASLARRQPDALNPDALSGATEPARTRTGMLVVRELEQLHRTRRLDQAPLALGAADPRARWIFGGEQRPANRGEIRAPAHDHEHRNTERCRKGVDVDHIEPPDRDSLEHHRTNVLAKLAGGDELDHALRRIRAIAANAPADD